MTTLSSISGGAVLTLEGKTATTAKGLEVVPELFDLLTDTVSRKSSISSEERAEITAFLKRLTRRYGTVRRAADAIGSARRRHPLVSREKARSWAVVMAVMPSAVETTLKRHPSLKIHISKWLADRGSAVDDRLDGFASWLDSPFPDYETDVPVTTAEAELERSETESFELDATDAKAMRLFHLFVEDKRPGLHPTDRRPDPEEVELRDELKNSPNAFARACVMLSDGRWEDADAHIRKHCDNLPAEILHTLKGECAYNAGRFDDALIHYRAAAHSCDSSECVLNLAYTLARATQSGADERSREALDSLVSLRDRQHDEDPMRLPTLIAIGAAWLQCPSGDRDANVSLAIESLETALAGIQQSTIPHWWAEAHLQLGAAWLARPSGKRTENIQRSITCFTRAEEVWDREHFPEHWASIQNNLGHAWESLPTGHRAINLQRAIDYFDAALDVRAELEHSLSVATLRNNLGNAWIQFPAGDHKDNVLRGIEHHSAALEVWSTHDKRHEWAATQNNLGNAWALLPADEPDERTKNLRRAIACYKSALDLRTRSATPIEWATTLNNMGSALIMLAGEKKAKPIREAIDCFNKALEVRTKAAYPLDWAKTQTNLGRAWERLPEGDPVRNIDKATEHFNEALTVFNETDYPHQYAHTRSILQSARDRIAKLGFG